MIRGCCIRWERTSAHKPPAGIRMDQIVYEVARRHNLGPKDLKGRDLRRCVTAARHEFMYLAMLAGKSSPQVAQFLGMDHTSVLSGANNHARRLRETETTSEAA